MKGSTWHVVAVVGSLLTAVLFAILLGDLVWQGLPEISLGFLWRTPSELSSFGGIGPELLNTLVMVGAASAITIPLGLAAAILRVEYGARPGFLVVFDRMRYTLLSLPTIVVGLMVYEWFIVGLRWPLSVGAGVIALTVVNWPFVVDVSVAALKGVPDSFREASLALGGTKYLTLLRVVLPSALSALVSGLGMAIARLMGESAVLIFTAGINVSRHWGWSAPGETLAVHLWYLRTESVAPHADAQAAATGVVLLLLVGLVLYLTQKLAHWLKPMDA